MKNKTPFWAIALVIFCTVLTSGGQYFIKLGANAIVSVMTVLNLNLIIGFLLYGFGAVFLLMALRHGKLSVLYPFISLGFIWVAFIGMFALGETLSVANWFGIGSIVAGVSFIGFGGNNG